MNNPDWSDPRIPKAFFKAPPPPTAFETEAFVSRVMTRIEHSRLNPLLEWFTGRWTVPALGLGIAALFLSILYSAPRGSLVLDASITGSDAPSGWVIPLDEEP